MANPNAKKGRFTRVQSQSTPGQPQQALQPGQAVKFALDNPDLPGQSEEVEVLQDGKPLRTVKVQLDDKGHGEFEVPTTQHQGRKITLRHGTVAEEYDASADLRTGVGDAAGTSRGSNPNPGQPYGDQGRRPAGEAAPQTGQPGQSQGDQGRR